MSLSKLFKTEKETETRSPLLESFAKVRYPVTNRKLLTKRRKEEIANSDNAVTATVTHSPIFAFSSKEKYPIADCKVSIKQIEKIEKSGIADAATVTHSPPSASSSQGARLIEILHSADDVLRKATQKFNKILTSPILK